MKLEQALIARSNNECELCTQKNNLSVYCLPPNEQQTVDENILVCENCFNQINKKEPLNKEHLKCLLTSMWSEVLPVQVVSWRILNRLSEESWAADALDLMYFEEDTLNWAKASNDHLDISDIDFHKDSNGAILQNGDTVVLIKSLDVKGSTVNARLGTVVKNIRLVPDNTEQIEGKIEGQTIVILTKYLRKG